MSAPDPSPAGACIRARHGGRARRRGRRGLRPRRQWLLASVDQALTAQAREAAITCARVRRSSTRTWRRRRRSPRSDADGAYARARPRLPLLVPAAPGADVARRRRTARRFDPRGEWRVSRGAGRGQDRARRRPLARARDESLPPPARELLLAAPLALLLARSPATASPRRPCARWRRCVAGGRGLRDVAGPLPGACLRETRSRGSQPR